MARAIGLNHVALDVGSVDEALDFWRALFPDLRLRSRSATMAFIDLGDQFIALFRHEVEPRSEHRHFGLVVDDVAAVLAAARALGARIRGDNVSDPWGIGNRAGTGASFGQDVRDLGVKLLTLVAS